MSEASGLEQPAFNYDEEWFSQRGIDDDRVIEVLGDVRRRPFVIPGDDGVAEMSAKTLPPVEVVGKLLTALQVEAHDTVLEVGTDTGYITAMLAQLGDEVYTVERRLQIAKLAEGRFDELEIDNVDILYGPRLGEYAAHAPYDAILVAAVAPRVPEKLKQRLGIGGRMVVPIGDGEQNPEVVCIRRVDEEDFEQKSLGQLRFSSKLGDILVELGVADREEVEIAALEADARGQRIGEALLEHALVEEQDLVKALAIQRGHNIASVDQLEQRADRQLSRRVPRAFMKHHQVIPVDLREGTLAVATVDPDTPTGDIARIVDAEVVEIYLVTADQFDRLWENIVEGLQSGEQSGESLKIRVEAKLEHLLRAAARHGARTIHLDNHPDGARIRLRVDGQLQMLPELNFEPAEVDYLVEFLELKAGLDVLEEQIPQRGRLTWRRDANTYHLKIHVMPSVTGRQLSIRVLSRGEGCPSLEQMDVQQELIDELKVVLQRLSGLFLVVGPRKMAKHQTLYALLGMLADDERCKVGAIEQRVKSSIPEVQQVTVCPRRDFGYREAIREFVRFDVDALGVDRLPEPEVVMEALEVARRGPKVLATLHGRDAAHVVAGLFKFGLAEELVANGISAIITQRLAPKLCPSCCYRVELQQDTAEELFDGTPPDGFKAFRAGGCADCSDRGTVGEVPLLELVTFGDLIRDAVAAGESAAQLRDLFARVSSRTIRDYAVELASQGTIAVDELRRFGAETETPVDTA